MGIKEINKYARLYRKALKKQKDADAAAKTEKYKKRLADMVSSEIYRRHNVFPSMNIDLIYAVVAMCLELKEQGLSDREIIDFSDVVFKARRQMFAALEKLVDLLPNSYGIAKKWNISDHDKRVRDGSLTFDSFEVKDGKIEYRISKCMYAELFDYYGIRSLCRTFCKTDEDAYANLTRHVSFIRHSVLADGNCCHDEIIRK